VCVYLCKSSVDAMPVGAREWLLHLIGFVVLVNTVDGKVWWLHAYCLGLYLLTIDVTPKTLLFDVFRIKECSTFGASLGDLAKALVPL